MTTHARMICLALLFAACATTSHEECARKEHCMRQCENAGVSNDRHDPRNGPGVSLTPCERKCGTCGSTLQTSPAPQAGQKPTHTGVQPQQDGY